MDANCDVLFFVMQLEDLLQIGKFVLTARFQSDPIERRFGQYRQMSGGGGG